MKQKITSFLLLAIMWLAGVNAWALDQKDGVYQIGSAQDLADFAALVNTGTNLGGANQACAILTADIDYTGQTTLIGDQARFCGVLDGNGHTVTVKFENLGANCALVKQNHGVIKNLCVKGDIITKDKCAAGITGLNYGYIENCLSLVNIYSTLSGDNTAGGIAGCSYNCSTVKNCVFAGSINAADDSSKPTNCGGIVGYLSGTTVLENCVMVGEMNIDLSNDGSNIISRNPKNGTFKNCFYKAIDGAPGHDAFVEVTDEQLKNGEVAFLTGMNQAISVDTYPTPLGTARVYATTTDCSGAGATGFTNTEIAPVAHTWNGDVCSVCGALNEEFVKPVNGVYQLGTVEQVIWFAKMVNAGHVLLNAELTADIDFAGVTDFPKIGTLQHPYRGKFDGKFHQIKNLVINTPDVDNVGFFAVVAGLVEIRNLTVDAGCEFVGKNCVGLIGQSNCGGVTTFSKLGNQGKMGCMNTGVAGIFGKSVGGVVCGNLDNCWFTGEITQGGECSFICGWFGSGQYSMTNCWSISEVSANMASNTCLGRYGGNGVVINNCFTVNGNQGTVVPAGAEKTGQLCWLLNGESGENPVWFQKLGTDAMPTLTGSDVVYMVGTKNCDGSATDDFGYANEDKGFVQNPHQLDEDGFCTVCGRPDQAEDGFYLIPNAKALKWVAEQINSGAMQSIDFRLTADIDLGKEAWVPIGNDNTMFSGNMDGGRHKISNMHVDIAGPAGLFGSVSTGNFYDFIIDASCSVKGTQWSGGVIGHSYGGRVNITNVGVMCSVQNEGDGSDSSAAGGLIGNANSGSRCDITRCFVTGSVTSTKDVAVFSAWQGNVGSVVKDCWHVAEIGDAVNIIRGTATIENCFAPRYDSYLTEANYTNPFISAEMLATGELCFKLNGMQDNLQWYQTLDEDATPVPWDDHKVVYGNGTLKCDGTAAEGVLTYSNTKGTDNTIPPHQYENGFCSVCGGFHKEYKTPVAGYYELGTPVDLHWFMILVNKENNTASAKLTEDIDLSEMVDVIKPMEQYGGTFDGQGHTIYGYQHISPVKDAGFIRFGLDGLHLKNVIFKNAKIHTDDYAAGLIGGNVSGETSTFRLTNVGFEGEVTAGNVNAAGLIGSNHGTSSTYIIENCYVRGSMTGLGGGESAAFSGWAGKNAQLNNCWTDATITGYQEGRDAIRYNTVSIKNSYCVSALESPQLPTISEDDIASGALTWKLNGESFLNVSWYQTVNQDEMPVWDSSHGLVYKNGEDSYASVQDEASYMNFREYIVDSELEKASEIVADEALLEAYRTSLEEMREIETLDEFLKAYAALDAQQQAIATSAALYAEYQKTCEDAITYLAENKLVCAQADLLDAYLNDDAAEPSETYKNGNYQYIVENHLLTDEEIAAETAYVTQLLNAAIAADYKAGTEITALLTNANLAEGFEGWTVTGTPVAGGVKEIMPAAEAYNTVFSVTQTLEGMKDGIYKLAVNAAFRPFGDLTSTLYAGTVSLNGNVNFAMAECEDVVLKEHAVDGENCLLTGDHKDYTYVYGDIEGYVPVGPVGCSYAFNAGRYLNYVAVEVKDGKLTVGVQNPGTGMTRDWMGFGNFHLTYLGTAAEADEGLTEVLAGYVDRATVIKDFKMSSAVDYAQYPNYSEELKGKLNTAIEAAATAADGAAKMALINEFSELFQQIYACRLAYSELLKTADAVGASLNTFFVQGLIDENAFNESMKPVDDAYLAYEEGTASIEKVQELIDAMNNNGVFPPVVDGVYQISNAKELGIFAVMVNGGQKDINAALTADIDLAGVANWTPIGFNTADNNASDASANVVTYAGKFDGQGHRIFNLTVNFPDGHGIGLFGTLDVGAEIKNLILDKTCAIIGYDKVGMIGRSTNGGDIYLDCLGNEGSVTANYQAGAGIMGNANNGSIAHISNCYSSGVISAGDGKNAALICGWLGSTNPGGQVTNCWSIAEISGQDNNEKVFCRIGNATFTNNYSLIGTGNMSKVVTMEDFKSGAVTFGLNTGETPVWYQNLGTDEHPVLDNTHQIVYKKEDGTFYNDGGNAIENVEGVLGETVNVYDVQGRQVRTAVSTATGLKGLSQGMYILKGQSKSVKVLVK